MLSALHHWAMFTFLYRLCMMLEEVVLVHWNSISGEFWNGNNSGASMKFISLLTKQSLVVLVHWLVEDFSVYIESVFVDRLQMCWIHIRRSCCRWHVNFSMLSTS